MRKNVRRCIKITDRGPADWLVRQGRTIDLSRAAFEMLADPALGTIDVSIFQLHPVTKQITTKHE